MTRVSRQEDLGAPLLGNALEQLSEDVGLVILESSGLPMDRSLVLAYYEMSLIKKV
jgi:hypothetical protein